jgi:hypothetical protein
MKLLVTESFKDSEPYSSIYFINEQQRLELIDYNNVEDVYETSETEFVQCWKNLSREISDMIIKILIDATLQAVEIRIALSYIFINRYHVKSFFNRFFPKIAVKADEYEYTPYIERVSAMLVLLKDTDAQLSHLYRNPVGFNGMNIELCKSDPWSYYCPWNYEGGCYTVTTTNPTVLLPKTVKKLTFKQINTGPFHKQIVWLAGASQNGIVDVEYYKNPLIVYSLYRVNEQLNEEEVSVNAQFFATPEFHGFGHLARLVFGQNTGVFFEVTQDLPQELIFTAPVVFEV